MRVVQKELDTIENDAKTRAMAAFNGCTEVVEQRLDLAPMDIGAHRIGEDGLEQVRLLVAHGGGNGKVAEDA